MTTTMPVPVASPTRTPDRGQATLAARVHRARYALTRWLATYSVTALRISLGLVILGFGALKFFPGASPAEELVARTTEALTLGLVGGTTAVVATAVLETVIGVTLLTGRLLGPGMLLMSGWLVGILMPVVLFPSDMFPGGLPTLAAQYVLKDVILVAAAMVVGAAVLGARLIIPSRPAT